MDALWSFLQRLIAPISAFIAGVVGYFKGKSDAQNDVTEEGLHAAKVRSDVEGQLDRADDAELARLRDKWSRK